MISQGNYSRLADQFLNLKDDQKLERRPGCYDIVLENRVTEERYETQGDIPDDPGYDWFEFLQWLIGDLEEMGLKDELDNIDLVSVEYAGLNNATDTICMCVYCDSTPFFSDEEGDEDNLVSLEFPTAIVREYFECFESNDTFEDWLKEYTADDTSSLYDFARQRGYFAQLGKEG